MAEIVQRMSEMEGGQWGEGGTEGRRFAKYNKFSIKHTNTFFPKKACKIQQSFNRIHKIQQLFNKHTKIMICSTKYKDSLTIHTTWTPIPYSIAWMINGVKSESFCR